MNISACLVTKGGTDLNEILDTITESGIHDILVWDNGRGVVERHHRPGKLVADIATVTMDTKVYGRYAAIGYAKGDFIYVQDDDCVLEPPAIEQILHPFRNKAVFDRATIMANMPQDFRHVFYEEHCLVGFGACFHRDLPTYAFRRLWAALQDDVTARGIDLPHGDVWDRAKRLAANPVYWPDAFLTNCDMVFTALTPYLLVDVPYRNLPWAHGDDRLYRRPGHAAERKKMLEIVMKARRQLAADEGVFV